MSARHARCRILVVFISGLWAGVALAQQREPLREIKGEPDTLRMRVNAPEGVLVVYDAPAGDAGADRTVFLAFWHDFADKRLFLYSRPVLNRVDVGQAVLDLARDHQVDVGPFERADRALAAGMTLAAGAPGDVGGWRPASLAMVFDMIGLPTPVGPDDDVQAQDPLALKCNICEAQAPGAATDKPAVGRGTSVVGIEGVRFLPAPEATASLVDWAGGVTLASQCCGGGGCVCPSDGNPCTTDACVSGICKHYGTCDGLVSGDTDCWFTPCGGTEYVFCDTPIPADFFEPGSQPFTGAISFGGADPNVADTEVQRIDDMDFDAVPGSNPKTLETGLQITLLDLVGCAPVPIEMIDGSTVEWNASVSLSASAVPMGRMVVTKEHENGGTFHAEFYIQPVFTFTRELPGGTIAERVFDMAAAGYDPVLFATAYDASWIHQLKQATSSCVADNFSPGVTQNADLTQCCDSTCHSSRGEAAHEHCTVRPGCPPCQRGGCCLESTQECLDVQATGTNDARAVCLGMGGEFLGYGTTCSDEDEDGLAGGRERGNCCDDRSYCFTGTHPGVPDTDGDGCLDGEELDGSPPTDPCDRCDYSAACGSGPPIDPPSPATLVSPLDGETGVSRNPTLSWTGDATIEGYSVWFGVGDMRIYYGDPVGGPTETTFTPDGPLYAGEPGGFGQTYRWYVVSYKEDECARVVATYGEARTFTVDSSSACTEVTPPAPTNPEPADGAVISYEARRLSWTGDAQRYHVHLGTDPLLANPAQYHVITTSKPTLPPDDQDFLPNTTYYWKVVVKNDRCDADAIEIEVSSPVWSFTTNGDCQPHSPTAPHTPHPTPNATEVPGGQITLDWQPFADSVDNYNQHYDVYFGDYDPLTQQASLKLQGTTSEPNLLLETALEPSAYYAWQVTARTEYCGVSSSVSGPLWLFDTCPADPLVRPGNPDPFNDEEDVTVGRGLTFTGDEDYHEFLLWFASPGHSAPYGVIPVENLGQADENADWFRWTTDRYPLWYAGQEYAWRIRTLKYDSCGGVVDPAQGVGPEWHFTTIPEGACQPTTPPAPVCLGPSDDIALPQGAHVLEWEHTALRYDVYFGPAGEPLPLLIEDWHGSSLLVYADQPNTTYEWYVVAKNSCTPSSSYVLKTTGAICAFTTGLGCNDPLVPIPYAPIPDDETTGLLASDEFVLAWYVQSPPGIAERFDVLVGLSPEDLTPVTPQEGLAWPQNNWTISTAPDTTYHWRVIARTTNCFGYQEEARSIVWTFSTCSQGNPLPASEPIPSDGDAGVSLTPYLTWQSDPNAVAHRIEFGPAGAMETRGRIPLGCDGTTCPCPQGRCSWPVDGPLQEATEYEWRVTTIVLDNCGNEVSVPGETWRLRTFEDCDQDGVADADQIASGEAIDLNGNNILDGCEPCGSYKTFTFDEDFDQGTSINVSHDAVVHQLRLAEGGMTTAFGFLWVAASARDTIVKIDTETGEILAEYYTRPSGFEGNPSRTTVDLRGGVWAGNRDEQGAADGSGLGSVVHIGLYEASDCVDRNGDGIITTSGRGNLPATPLAWEGTDETGATDECIVRYVRTNARAVRHLSIDADNNIWVGGNPGNAVDVFDKIDGATGAILSGFSAIAIGCGGYGGLIDANGILWSATRNSKLLRYDPTSGVGQCVSVPDSYGLGIDGNGYLWNSQFGRREITKLAPDGTIVEGFPKTTKLPGDPTSSGLRGVAVTPIDNHVWVADSYANTLTRLDNDGNILEVIDVGSVPTGVAVDANGKVWVTNQVSDNAIRIDPTAGPNGLGAVDHVTQLPAGSGPYNYSDMTGLVANQAARDGRWCAIYDRAAFDTVWDRVYWNTEACVADPTPPGTSLSVEVRAGDTLGSLGPYTPVGLSGDPLAGVTGRFVEVCVTLSSDGTSPTPVLCDLTVTSTGTFTDADQNGIPDECQPIPRPRLETGTVTAGGSAVMVPLRYEYVSPVVVCSVRYAGNFVPVVTRVGNVTPRSFDVYLQNPAGASVMAESVSYVVAEEGVWDHAGLRFEAHRYTSTVTDHAGSWAGRSQTHGQTYVNPVVVGQVMSTFDPDYSVFWSAESNSPPAAAASSTSLVTGKTVGEDPDTTRADEIVGYVVVEAGTYGVADGLMQAFVGPTSVGGVDDAAPYSYALQPGLFAAPPQVVINSKAGLLETDGGWSQSHGTVPATADAVKLSIDEDQLGDLERSHALEAVSVFAFDGSVAIEAPPPCDTDDDCVDLNPCTDDLCQAGGCVNLPNTRPCSDGLFCNGVNTCAGGVCQPAGYPCGSQRCDEALAACVDCLVSIHCDDGNACTDDSCVGGTCTHVHNSAACNNGVFCDGADYCADGVCTSIGDPCLIGGQLCDESAGRCVDCLASTDCPDDGLFCNGVPECIAGQCLNADEPCIVDCDEATDSCTNMIVASVRAADGVNTSLTVNSEAAFDVTLVITNATQSLLQLDAVTTFLRMTGDDPDAFGVTGVTWVGDWSDVILNTSFGTLPVGHPPVTTNYASSFLTLGAIRHPALNPGPTVALDISAGQQLIAATVTLTAPRVVTGNKVYTLAFSESPHQLPRLCDPGGSPYGPVSKGSALTITVNGEQP